MNCSEVRKYLDAYVDSELEVDSMIGVDNHLDRCEICSALALVRRKLKSELGALGQMDAPDHLRRRLKNMSGKRRRPWAAAILIATPVAAAASLLLVFGRSPTKSADPPSPVEPLATVFEDVAKQAARPWPMEFKSPDPNEAARWLQDKVDFPVRSPKLKLANASLEGTRLSHAGSHPAAQWAYKVDGHPVTMMIFNTHGKVFTGGRSIELDGRNVLAGRKNGFNLAIAFQGDMACALASDLPQGRLLELVLDFCKSW